MQRHLRGPRKRQSKRRGTRAGCANVKANAGNPAQAAQTSRQMPRNSRRLRKRQSKCRETRAARANVKANAARLAQPAQTSRQMPRNPARPAQTSRQMPRDPAQAAQTSRQMPRNSRRLRKRQSKRRETRAGCAIKPALIQHHGPLGVATQLVDHTDVFG